jgi:hypothetical protein
LRSDLAHLDGGAADLFDVEGGGDDVEAHAVELADGFLEGGEGDVRAALEELELAAREAAAFGDVALRLALRRPCSHSSQKPTRPGAGPPAEPHWHQLKKQCSL